MSVLISGSLAFDNIMVFQDKFRNHILPDQIHILNVSFFVPEMRKEFGGCAGNIAYANKLLGGNPMPMGTVGSDFTPYMDYMKAQSIDTQAIKVMNEHFTAQAFITTDIEDNQITAFHPGAMSVSDKNDTPNLANISMGIISPDSKEGMVKNAKMLKDNGISIVFDPGQALPLYSGDDIKAMIEMADYVIANDYESKLIEDKSGLDSEAIAAKVKAYIVTLGAKGVQLYKADNEPINIKAANISLAIDPTGCGDAFRGGFLFGLEVGKDEETAIRIGAIMGAKKIESKGPQNYTMTTKELVTLYKSNYDVDLTL